MQKHAVMEINCGPLLEDVNNFKSGFDGGKKRRKNFF